MEEIFAIWPSLAEMARDLNRPYPTIVSWRRRGSIPVAYFKDVVAAARARGSDLTVEELAAACVASKRTAA